jgi:hypothetical protein
MSRAIVLLVVASADAALQPPSKPPPNAASSSWVSSAPDLPLDAIVLEEPDEAVWSDETLEFNGLRSDPRTPVPLQAHLASFRLPNGMCCHAFEGSGATLAKYGFDDNPLQDRGRVALLLQLLESVNFLHGRGSAHLGLDGEVVRVVARPSAAPTRSRSSIDPAGAVISQTGETAELVELRLLGLGAAVRLQSAPRKDDQDRRNTFLLPNAVSFHAPELLSSAVVETNLRSLFQFDAWSVGLLVTMIAGDLNSSPVEAAADWRKGLFSEEAATRARILHIQGNLGGFLTDLDEGSGGFLFRHGWVVRIVIGLLEINPAKRLTVYQAWQIARDAVASDARTRSANDGLAAYAETAASSATAREEESLQGSASGGLAPAGGAGGSRGTGETRQPTRQLPTKGANAK